MLALHTPRTVQVDVQPRLCISHLQVMEFKQGFLSFQAYQEASKDEGIHNFIKHPALRLFWRRNFKGLAEVRHCPLLRVVQALKQLG